MKLVDDKGMLTLKGILKLYTVFSLKEYRDRRRFVRLFKRLGHKCPYCCHRICLGWLFFNELEV